MLAIVIPFFKIKFFEENLTSLAAQTNKNFNVYIGNDASPNNPEGLIDSFKTSLNITYKRFEENLGGTSLTKQWDRCIAMVQEEKWIMILGDDDMLDSSVVNAFYKHIDVFRKKTKVVRFASKIITEKTKIASDIFEHPTWEHAENSYFRRLRGFTRSSLSEYIFEKQTYLKHGFYPYPLAWASDDRAWLDFSENTPIYTINEAVLFVRNSSINITGRTDNEDLKNKATTMFYRYMISNKLHKYNMRERIFLMRAGENEILKSRNLKMQDWLFFIYHHCRNFEFNSFKKLIKRFVKSLLNY